MHLSQCKEAWELYIALSIKYHEETQETEYDVLEFCRLFLLWERKFLNIF